MKPERTIWVHVANVNEKIFSDCVFKFENCIFDFDNVIQILMNMFQIWMNAFLKCWMVVSKVVRTSPAVSSVHVKMDTNWVQMIVLVMVCTHYMWETLFNPPPRIAISMRFMNILLSIRHIRRLIMQPYCSGDCILVKCLNNNYCTTFFAS